MKRLMLLTCSIIAFCATSVVGYSQYNNEKSLFIENIEALSSGEGEWDHPNGQPESNTYICGNSGCTSTIRQCQGGGSGCNVIKCSTHK
ncbi:MAG: hypothetical protein ACRDCN_03690 [Tannerellaceae bacterium]